MNDDHSTGRSSGRHILASPSLVPEALVDDGDDDDDDNRRSPASNHRVKDTDISKDFEDLKNFVHETQSKSRQFDDLTGDSGDGGESATPRQGTSFDTSGSRERDFPPLPDFSSFEQIDFNSGELDPDLLQVSKPLYLSLTNPSMQ